MNNDTIVATSSSPKTVNSLDDGYVDDRMWQRIENNFVAADFWDMSSERNVSGPAGARIYLEACKNGRYQTVERASGDSEFATIVSLFTMVGKLEWLEGN